MAAPFHLDIKWAQFMSLYCLVTTTNHKLDTNNKAPTFYVYEVSTYNYFTTNIHYTTLSPELFYSVKI